VFGFEDIVQFAGPFASGPHEGRRIEFINLLVDKQAMTTIRIGEERALVEEEIETYYEKEITPIGNSAKVGVPKRYRGQEALVIILAVED